MTSSFPCSVCPSLTSISLTQETNNPAIAAKRIVLFIFNFVLNVYGYFLNYPNAVQSYKLSVKYTRKIEQFFSEKAKY
jgi:hypothetical protein